MATTHSPASSPSPSTTEAPKGRWLKLADAAEFLGVSQTTARLLADGGELGPVHTTPGGHRRISYDGLAMYAYGERTGGSGAAGRLIGLCRVSSRKQASKTGRAEKSSLEHQEERVRDFCKRTHNRQPDEMILSVGSGMNFSRPEFLALLKRVVSGELRGATIVATDCTRVCRFGIELVEYLCEWGGVKIDYSNPEATSENESLVEDVLAILTHFTARVSGNKARLALRVEMDPEHLQTAYRLYKQGKTYAEIERSFLAAGLKDGKGRDYSRAVIRSRLTESWDVLEAAA